MSAATMIDPDVTCPTCSFPGALVQQEERLLVEHPGRMYPCRVPDYHYYPQRATFDVTAGQSYTASFVTAPPIWASDEAGLR